MSVKVLGGARCLAYGSSVQVGTPEPGVLADVCSGFRIGGDCQESFGRGGDAAF